ncbi:MAG: NAD(P)-dependent oxidoreductase, partial [Acidobacteriota bacterium]
GAQVESTPRRAARGASAVVAMVTDDDASRAVWLDPLEGALLELADGAVAVDASTLTPEWARELADAVAAAGGSLLDAPVVGTRPQAEAGQLIFLVGGDEATYRRAESLLAAMGRHRHAGPSGHGMAIKLAANALFALQVTGLAEALGLAKSAGIDVGRAAEILGSLPTTSPALGGVLAQIKSGSYAPLFPVDLVAKDLDYAVRTGAAGGVDMALSRTTLDAFEAVKRRGFGGENIAAVARLYL